MVHQKKEEIRSLWKNSIEINLINQQNVNRQDQIEKQWKMAIEIGKYALSLITNSAQKCPP
jgi:hypothetical protein